MGDDEPGKLFIGGVDKDTSKDDFKAFFEEKGELTDWVLMKDPINMGRNRGFGFVTYKDPEVAKRVLSSGPLILNGKKLDPKPCQKREDQKKQMDGRAEPDSPNKLFVGGIAQGSTKDSIEAAFSAYGKVSFVQLMTDRNTGNHRGFGFITFESPEPVEMLRKQRFVQCDDKTVECKPAESRYRFQGPGGGGRAQWGAGGQGGGNWQGPPGGQGDYSYQSGGWGGQPAMGGMWGQQQQMAGSYGTQGGYGQQPNNSWGPGYGGGYGGQNSGGYGGGYGQQPFGNQYSAQGNYGGGQSYGGNYAGGYGTGAPQQGGQYGPPGAAAGYNQGGYGAGYSNSNSYQQPPAAAAGGSDPNSSGGPMPVSYGQRMGNNAQQYHPYRR